MEISIVFYSVTTCWKDKSEDCLWYKSLHSFLYGFFKDISKWIKWINWYASQNNNHFIWKFQREVNTVATHWMRMTVEEIAE